MVCSLLWLLDCLTPLFVKNPMMVHCFWLESIIYLQLKKDLVLQKKNVQEYKAFCEWVVDILSFICSSQDIMHFGRIVVKVGGQ